MAIPIGVVAGTAVNFASDIFNGNDKDPERFAKIATWFQQAVAGDAIALCKLKYMSGRFGSGTCGGSAASGFATDAAKNLAFQKYNEALAILKRGGAMDGTAQSTGVLVGTSDGAVSGVAGTTFAGLGSPATNPLLWIVLAGVAVALYRANK